LVDVMPSSDDDSASDDEPTCPPFVFGNVNQLHRLEDDGRYDDETRENLDEAGSSAYGAVAKEELGVAPEDEDGSVVACPLGGGGSAGEQPVAYPSHTLSPSASAAKPATTVAAATQAAVDWFRQQSTERRDQLLRSKVGQDDDDEDFDADDNGADTDAGGPRGEHRAVPDAAATAGQWVESQKRKRAEPTCGAPAPKLPAPETGTGARSSAAPIGGSFSLSLT
jgi:hypothetical protein